MWSRADRIESPYVAAESNSTRFRPLLFAEYNAASARARSAPNSGDRDPLKPATPKLAVTMALAFPNRNSCLSKCFRMRSDPRTEKIELPQAIATIAPIPDRTELPIACAVAERGPHCGRRLKPRFGGDDVALPPGNRNHREGDRERHGTESDAVALLPTSLC